MKKLLGVVVLIITLHTSALCDDIQDLEIEGMSVGDSLLDYYSKDEIEKEPKYIYENKKFIGVELILKNSKEYEVVQFHYKPNGKYIIASVIGAIFFKDYNNCKKKKDEIVRVLSTTLENFKKKDRGTFEAREDKSGKSTMSAVEFHFENGEVGVTCTNYSNKFKIEKNYADNLRVDVSTKEFADWLRYEAYNK